MSAPDFFFANNAIFRYLHDRYGKEALIDYWRCLGREYYRRRGERWREGGPAALAADWQAYFAEEPQTEMECRVEADAVTLEIKVCPAIKHLRDQHREVMPCFCEHCDHVGDAMAQEAGYTFERHGGDGSCRQRFVRRSSQP